RVDVSQHVVEECVGRGRDIISGDHRETGCRNRWIGQRADGVLQVGLGLETRYGREGPHSEGAGRWGQLALKLETLQSRTGRQHRTGLRGSAIVWSVDVDIRRGPQDTFVLSQMAHYPTCRALFGLKRAAERDLKSVNRVSG